MKSVFLEKLSDKQLKKKIVFENKFDIWYFFIGLLVSILIFLIGNIAIGILLVIYVCIFIGIGEVLRNQYKIILEIRKRGE